jgi:hypothetical protein
VKEDLLLVSPQTMTLNYRVDSKSSPCRSCNTEPNTDAEAQYELAQIEAESMGWTPLEPGVYLHVSDATATEVLVVGLARAEMPTSNLLWVY